jgi:hypothetical protein
MVSLTMLSQSGFLEAASLNKLLIQSFSDTSRQRLVKLIDGGWSLNLNTAGDRRDDQNQGSTFEPS